MPFKLGKIPCKAVYKIQVENIIKSKNNIVTITGLRGMN